jgi:IclR family transcriptional regulator, acetate operon repressor
MQNQRRPRGRPKSQFKESSAGTMQALDRALGVLTAVAQRDRSALTDLAQALDIPTATTHRILTTLQKHGYVGFDEDRQEWMIGIEAYRAGATFLKRNSVIEIGQTRLRKLMRDTGETANLAVPDGPNVVFVGQVETENPIRAFFPPGSRTRMHASGTGKAILATMAEDALNRFFRDADLPRHTEHTLVTRAELEADLVATRARGWSHDHAERYLGMSCIGAAIFNERGLPCGGVSVSGPSGRFATDSIADIGARVAAAAAEITQASGGKPKTGA